MMREKRKLNTASTKAKIGFGFRRKRKNDKIRYESKKGKLSLRKTVNFMSVLLNLYWDDTFCFSKESDMFISNGK